MAAYLSTADEILRRAAATHSRPGWHGVGRLFGCLIVFALLYGATMGTYRGLNGQSQWGLQIIYSALKVPLLLLITFAISLPSFFVLNSLLGLRRDFPQALRAVVSTQAGLAVILASFAPFTVLWYASSTDYRQALVFNGAMFAIASASAQWLLRQYYRPLIASNPRHRWILWSWLAVYMLVAIQLAWLLRPFIGAPNIDVQFLRPEAWDNAYVRVLRLVGEMFGG